MTATAPSIDAGARRAPRLNPFAFPSDTDFRFVLLIVSVLGSSLLLYAAVYESLPMTRDYKRTQYEQCARTADPTDLSGTYAEKLARVLASNECTATADRLEGAWMLGGAAIVLAVGGALYWTFPRRRIRQQHLVPLDDSAADVVADLNELCRETGLDPKPVFMWNPLNGTRSGLAFGHLGQRYIALSGGLVMQSFRDRPAFRAVVLHELAHLRNADVDRTYFTVALWQAFVVAALVPFGVGQLVSGRSIGEIVDSSWRIAPLAALVYLTRNAVLRAREVYADVRASTWDEPAGGLRRSIEALPSPKRNWWTRLWQVHPDPLVRRRALDDTRPLFRIGVWDALATGLAAGIALPTVVVLLGLLVPMPIAMMRPLAAAFVCAPLAVGVVGLAVWRATFAALPDRAPPRGAGRAGIALGIGLVLGQELSLGAVEFGRGQGPLADMSVLALNLVWGGILAMVLFIFFRWIAACAAAWLEVTADDPSPGDAYRIGLGIAGALLAGWLGMLFFLYLSARTGGAVFSFGDLQDLAAADTSTQPEAELIASEQLVRSAAATLVGFDLLALVSIVTLCVYPLAAWLWRHRRVAPTFASWAFLDSLSPPLLMPLQAPLRPGVALAVGVVAGLAYTAATVLVYFALTGDSDALAAWTQAGALALAIVTQTLAAVVVSAWLPRLAALHGLCAAVVGGWLMGIATVAVLAANRLLWDDVPLTLFFVSAFVIGGAAVAAPLAMLTAAIAARLRG